MSFHVTTSWHNLNLKGPSAWDAAVSHYQRETGNIFSELPRDQQIAYVRAYVNRK